MTTNNDPYIIHDSTARQFKIVHPKHYKFIPAADMTPVESAWCAHFFAWLVSNASISAETYPNWPYISRHFTELVPTQPTATETGQLYSAGCAL